MKGGPVSQRIKSRARWRLTVYVFDYWYKFLLWAKSVKAGHPSAPKLAAAWKQSVQKLVRRYLAKNLMLKSAQNGTARHLCGPSGVAGN
jgi:hypothetical protein